jgi:hypothetical protein
MYGQLLERQDKLRMRRHHGAYDIDTTLSRTVRAAGRRAWRRRSAHVPCRLQAVLTIRLRPVWRST